MAFTIEFLDTPVPEEWLLQGEQGVLAKITIGRFQERFMVHTKYWSKPDYMRQWIDGVRRILDEREVKSVIVTSILDSPTEKYAAMCWPLYKQDSKVYIQNYFQPSNTLKYPIQIDELYSSIGERQKDVSEWIVSLDDLREWALAQKAELKSQRDS